MWYLGTKKGLHLMDGAYEVEFLRTWQDPTPLSLAAMASRASVLINNMTLDDAPKKPITATEANPRGPWVWAEDRLAPGHLKKLQNAGVKRVYLKLFDDASEGNGVWGGQAHYVKDYLAAGIEVWAWGYHFDNGAMKPIAQSIAAINQLRENGVTGYVVDLEREVEDGKYNAEIKELLIGLRQAFPGKLGYTTFGHPGYHPGVPWKLLDQYCDYAFLQLYTELFTFGVDAQDEIDQCLKAYNQLGLVKPVLPIFSSEAGVSKPESVQVLQRLLDKYPGSSLWRVPEEGESGHAYLLNYGPRQNAPDAPKAPSDTPSDVRSALTRTATEWVAKARSHAPGNWIDTNVLDPLRQEMIELGHLGKNDWDSFFNWCASEQTAITKAAGFALPVRPKVNGQKYWATLALVETWVSWAKSIGAWKSFAQALPGDFIIYSWQQDGIADHIGMCVGLPKDGQVLSAEGNHGNKEWLGMREKAFIMGIVDAEKLIADLPNQKSKPGFYESWDISSLSGYGKQLEETNHASIQQFLFQPRADPINKA